MTLPDSVSAEAAAQVDAQACDLCGSPDREVVSRIGRDFRPLVNVVCRHCGLMRQDPMPTEAQLRDYYARQYRLSYKGAAEPRERDLARDRRRAEDRLAMLAPVLKPGMRILDLGSGTGMFLLLARERGYAVQGIEPDESYAARLKQKFNIPVHAGSWDTAEFAPGSFDLVVVHHVLEHLRAPTETLRRIHQWTASDGCLYLAVPNMKNPSASPLNRFHPAHLYGYSHETLVMMARKAGFERLDLPNTGETQIVFRRLAAAHADWFAFPGHGTEMMAFYRDHTVLKYFMRPVAYRRVAGRIKRALVGR